MRRTALALRLAAVLQRPTVTSTGEARAAFGAGRRGHSCEPAADQHEETVARLLRSPDGQALVAALNARSGARSALVLSLSGGARRAIAVEAAAADSGAAVVPGELRRELSAVDVDQDGTISRREFTRWLVDHGGAGAVEAEGTVAAAAVSGRQLLLLGVNIAVPMVGFGFVDNVTMIMAGDAIDGSIGTAFGLSMLASAALGNLVSDVAGIGMGDVVEGVAKRLGLPSPRLSPRQMALRSVRVVGGLSGAAGIAVGCLLGMAPLLFMEDSYTRRTRELFRGLDANGDGVLKAAELETVLAGLGVPEPQAAARGVLEALGKAGSGGITAEEFLQHSKVSGLAALAKKK
jgi:Ca2+-binding EF-hand superfamily protein